MSNKYGQKRFDTDKKSTMDAIKTAFKRAIQKTEEATTDLIGNKIADKIAGVSKKNLLIKIMMMQNQQLTKKDIYHQKKGNKLLTN